MSIDLNETQGAMDDRSSIPPETPAMYQQSIASAQIDAARICAHVARELYPDMPPRFVRAPGIDSEEGPDVRELLHQARDCLDAARIVALRESGRAPTSIHTIEGALLHGRATAESGTCVLCGCTDDNACRTEDGGCSWVDAAHTICSVHIRA